MSHLGRFALGVYCQLSAAFIVHASKVPFTHNSFVAVSGGAANMPKIFLPLPPEQRDARVLGERLRKAGLSADTAMGNVGVAAKGSSKAKQKSASYLRLFLSLVHYKQGDLDLVTKSDDQELENQYLVFAQD
eukprot:7201410-Prymnesium_polylepis.1